MVHSNKTFMALLLSAAVICGCSQREAIDIIDNNETEMQETASVVFHIKTNVVSEASTRTAEDSYTHEQGTADEYKVNNVRVYMYDYKSKLFVKKFLLTNLTRSGSDTEGNIIYATERVLVPKGTFDIFVTANSDRIINKENEADFLADIDSTSYVRAKIEDISKGILMTNRAADNDSTVITSNSQNDDNVVTITLERVLARIDVGKSSPSFQLTYGPTSTQYATITLDGYYIVNLPKYFYSYRHTAVLKNMTAPAWSLNENFGNVKDVDGYVIDPYFFKKAIDASNFTNADKYYENFYGDCSDPNAISWTTFPAATATSQYKTVYCLENCMFAPAQKNGYSTGIIFRAKMEPYNNVYKLATDSTLQLVTNKSDYAEVLYYYNYNFYNSADALAKAIGIASVTEASMDLYQVHKYDKTDDGYRCYYKYWIRHLDNQNDNNMGVMEFAIVRNNFYKILVASVSGLGYSTLPVNPDTPDEGETYLKVILNVKPWIVRDLTNIVL